MTTDSFTLCTHEGICSVITHSRLPKDRLRLLLEFIFKAYAPITLIAQSVGDVDYAYTFAQEGEVIDTAKLLKMLSRLEIGWYVSEGVIFSPRPSKLDVVEVEEIVLNLGQQRAKSLSNQS